MWLYEFMYDKYYCHITCVAMLILYSDYINIINYGQLWSVMLPRI